VGHERGAYVVAVDAWEVTVENDDVVDVDLRPLDCQRPIEDDIDSHPAIAQPVGDVEGQHLVIFDDEHPHVAIVTQSG